MATNTGNGYRKGAVKRRSEIKHPKNPGYTIKRNDDSGQFMNVKKGSHKGVRGPKKK